VEVLLDLSTYTQYFYQIFITNTWIFKYILPPDA
jgi:hypothetical protein